VVDRVSRNRGRQGLTAFLARIGDETKLHVAGPQSPDRRCRAGCRCSINVQCSTEVDEKSAKPDERERGEREGSRKAWELGDHIGRGSAPCHCTK
jgi:hypothetical protein